MRFDSIRLRGLGPFREEVSLDLTRLPGMLCAITGDNGAGKSSLLELFAGALYRQTPTRGSLASLANARDAFVEVRAVNGHAWTIRQVLDGTSGKGESLVLDDAGVPALASAKVRDFDAWAASHLPSPEVLYASTFAAQGGGGNFLEMGAGERKACLLRTLGIEHYERLAEGAREHARKTKSALSTLTARIADERARGGDAKAIEAELTATRASAAEVDAAAIAAHQALRQAEAEATDAGEALRAYQRRAAEAADLLLRAVTLEGRLVDLEKRLANNRAVLADRDAIRAAVERLHEVQAALTQTTLDAGRERGHADQAEREGRQNSARIEDHVARLRQVEARADGARRVLAGRQAIEDAAAALDGERTIVDRSRSSVADAEVKLEQLRGQRLADDGERIVGLRDGLVQIAQGTDDSDELASRVLRTDDGIVARAQSLPTELLNAQKLLTDARRELRSTEERLRATETTALRAPQIAQAQADLEATDHDVRQLRQQIDELESRGRELSTEARTHREELVAAKGRLDAAETEKTTLAPLAKRAEPLAQAEARIAEIEPQVEATRAEAAALRARAAEVAPAGDAPRAPDLVAAQRRAADADFAAKTAHGRVAVAEQRLVAAQEAAARLADLDGERRALDDELSDWARLSEDLGRDGLQSLEIDCAGPELTELVNDLLHTCIGPRWTVSIEATRTSADGKRQLEGCEVRVLDTERGRDTTAETLSGGEQVLVGEAVSLALSMLACRRSGVVGPTIFRDETGAALAPGKGRQYIAMLRRAAEIVGASRVLFVSHSQELQELADARIEVRDGKVTVQA